MNKKILSLCASALACTGLAAQSLDSSQGKQQNDSVNIQRLNEVVVTDSRFGLKRENSGKTVIKISSEELKRSQGKTIAELINTKSGTEIAGSRGREGAILGVFARGGRGRQVLVIVDGVRVTDPSSFSQEYDLRLFSTANVESIEIIKGAASALYGANAATAVINITTKKASQKRAALNVQTSRGTNQSAEDQNYNLSSAYNVVNLSGTLDKFTYQMGFSNRFSNGLSALITPENQEDVFSTFGTDVKIGYRFSKVFKIGIYGNQSKLETDYDETFGMIDAPYQFKSEQKRAGMSSEFDYGNGSLHLNMAYATYDSENISIFPSEFSGENLTADLYNKLSWNDAFYTIVGLNYIKDRTEFVTSKDFTIVDPYANVVYVSDYGLNLNIGARLNYHSEYGNHFVYSVNPSYAFETEDGYLKFLGSYATSYITPSLTQLFGSFGANSDLGPEENRTLEGGFEYAFNNKLRLSSVYFDREEENAVVYNNLTQTYANTESTIDAQGVEFELNWHPMNKLQISGNYTFTERKGDTAIRIPKHKANMVLGYDFSKKTIASISYSYTGIRFDTDFSTFENVKLPKYSLVDLYVSHELLPKKFMVFLGISNIWNEKYTEIIGFTTRGRNVRAGMSLTL